jgi:hypothetical protein
MANPRILANSPKTFLDRDNWMRAVLAAGLPPVVRVVAVRIALHLHVDSGKCDPGYDALAAELGMSKRSIIRIVAMLEHTGWIEVARPGHHQPNRFFLLRGDRGDKTQSPLRGDKTVSPQNTSEVTDSNVRGDRISTSEVTHVVTHKAKRKQIKRKAKEESDSPAVALRDENKGTPDERNLFGKTESGPQAPRKNRGAHSGAQYRDPSPRGTATARKTLTHGAAKSPGFDDFWRAYPKRVAKEAARKAYGKAIERGATPAALLAGAQRYAAERKDQDPKYTKHPATWLNGGCWEDELPGGAVIDQEGNVLAIQQPPPQRPRRTGFAAIADEMIEENERDIAAGLCDARGWPIWTR